MCVWLILFSVKKEILVLKADCLAIGVESNKIQKLQEEHCVSIIEKNSKEQDDKCTHFVVEGKSPNVKTVMNILQNITKNNQSSQKQQSPKFNEHIG